MKHLFIALLLVWATGCSSRYASMEPPGLVAHKKYIRNTTDVAICDGVAYGNSNYINEAQRRGLTCDQGKVITEQVAIAQTSSSSATVAALEPTESSKIKRADTVTEGKRTALVIGNSRYAELRHLRNPSEDAEAVSAKLTSLGFDVIRIINADKRQMERALRDFGDKSQAATISLVYYAGHGLQVDGKNYLLPTDARIRKRRDLNYEVIDLATVIAELQSDKRANIIILDSCRDNPLTAQYASNYRSVGATRGLAVPITSTIGTLIAFATSPNKVAADGDGKHSPYATAFLRWINEPGLEIGEVFRRIREDVVKATNGQQVPWENSSLIGGGIFISR